MEEQDMRHMFAIATVLLASAVLLAGIAAAEEVTFRFIPLEDWELTTCSARGSFNDWGETLMAPQEDGSWAVVLDLEPGEYHYKYFVNGEWPRDMERDLNGGPVDAEADGYVDDGYSGQNAVRFVGIEPPGADIAETSVDIGGPEKPPVATPDAAGEPAPRGRKSRRSTRGPKKRPRRAEKSLRGRRATVG